MTVRLLHADCIVLGDLPPVRDGALVVAGLGHHLPEGTIIDSGRASEVLPRHLSSAMHAGVNVERIRGILLPGLVNAHTHLELSAIGGKVPGGRGFVPWVEGLLAQRFEPTPDEHVHAIAQAADELVAAGTVAVGDVTNTLDAVTALAERGIGGCVFHEVFGFDRAAVLERVRSLDAVRKERIPTWPSVDLAYAPAPHTLYTTHADAVKMLVEYADSLGAITSVHFAEHAAERLAIEQGTGMVAEWLVRRTRIEPEWPREPLLAFAERLGIVSPRVLLVHAVDIDESEWPSIEEKRAPVVLCPRSNLHIEGQLPRLEAMRRAGVAPALGTDSLASSPSLDVLAEAKTLADHFPAIAAWELICMATYNGAQALGRGDLGRLSPGANPGVIAIEPGPEFECSEAYTRGCPAAFVLAHLQLPRRCVVSRGKKVVA